MTAIPTGRRPDSVVRGAVLIVGAVFLMSLQDAVIKYASTDLPLWQIYVLRALVAMPGLVALAALGGEWPGSSQWVMRQCGRVLGRWVLLRAALLVGMYVFMYASMPVLSLSTVAAAFYTGPLFITLLSAWVIGEPVGRRGWLAVAMGFAGVLCILRPGSDAFESVALLPVLSGLCYAFAAIVTRSRCQDEPPAILALSLNLALLVTGTVASLAIILWRPSPAESGVYPFLLSGWATMGATEWGFVGLLAVLIIGIGLGLAAAYQAAPPVVVATFDYSYLIFATVWSLTIFSEVPDAPTIAGMALIASAGLLVVRR